jgi:hypothetical protein
MTLPHMEGAIVTVQELPVAIFVSCSIVYIYNSDGGREGVYCIVLYCIVLDWIGLDCKSDQSLHACRHESFRRRSGAMMTDNFNNWDFV